MSADHAGENMIWPASSLAIAIRGSLDKSMIEKRTFKADSLSVFKYSCYLHRASRY